jgi:hypothetical protein
MTGTLGRGLGKADMFAEMESKLRERRAKAEGLSMVCAHTLLLVIAIVGLMYERVM